MGNTTTKELSAFLRGRLGIADLPQKLELDTGLWQAMDELWQRSVQHIAQGRVSEWGGVLVLDEELTLRGYTHATRKNYRLQTQRFLKWLAAQPGGGPDPATATEKELRAYLAEILNSGLSVSYFNQARAALIVIYADVLK